MNYGYEASVVIDFGYVLEFLKAHDITQTEFTHSLGYSPNWFNKRKDCGGTVRWRVVKQMLEIYAFETRRLVKDDPIGIFLADDAKAEQQSSKCYESIEILKAIAEKLDGLTQILEELKRCNTPQLTTGETGGDGK